MEASVSVILLAAGSSTRMGWDKLTLPLAGRTALEYSLLAFLRAGIAGLQEIVIAVSDGTRRPALELAARYGGGGVAIRLAEGGATRGDSVYNALVLCQGDVVAIHDAARCLVSRGIIADSIAGARERGSGVAALPCRDTLWWVETAQTLPREGLQSAQTPQSFARARILEAYEHAKQGGASGTDDASIYRLRWGEVNFTQGGLRNQKLTTREDIPLFEALLGRRLSRSGYGEDTHRLVKGRDLVLGGVKIPFALGLLGHSDADALTHAAIDALLGAAALGDIGSHFPDTDPRYAGACSLELLGHVRALLGKAGYLVGNLDVTVTAQQPKLAPYIPEMRENLARVLCCGLDQISVKATTPEGCGPEGELLCITARCVCSLEEYIL